MRPIYLRVRYTKRRNSSLGVDDPLKRVAIILLVTAVWLGSLAATTMAAEKDKVSIVLSWFATGLNAPHYYAEDLGYYAEENLEVEIIEGKGSGIAVQMVGAGTHPFGAADAAAMAQGVGAGVPVKMVAGLVQKSPVVLLSLPGSGLDTPQSLKGKSVVMPPGSGQASLFPVLLAQNGMRPNDVRVVSAEATTSINLVLEKKADAVGNYGPTAVAIFENALGESPTTLYFADFGVPTLSTGLIVNASYLQKNPDIVRRFVRATVRGWAAAMENPRAAAESYVKRFPENDVDMITSMTEGFTSLMRTPNTEEKPLGWMSAEDWQDTLDILVAANMLPSRSRNLDTYYTNDFVE